MVTRTMVCSALLASTWAMGQALAADAGEDLRLESELVPAQVLVQSQAIYRLRFYQAVDVQEVTIVGPSARLAEIRPIGAERMNEVQRDGRRYRLRERSYTVFPFGSGALVLDGAHVTGRIATVAGTSPGGRRAIRLEAPVQTLTVLPIPTAAAGTAADAWLPARSLILSERWSNADTQLGLGQAVERSIRIQATGAEAGQIPPVQLVAPGMLVHAEPPRLENTLAGEINVGVREQTFRFVPLRSGALVVPELRLSWWNVNAEALTIATLPARTLRVAAGQASAEPGLAEPVRQPAEPSKGVASAMPDRLSLLLATLALLCAAAALAWVQRAPLCLTWRLRRALRRGNAGAVRDALLQWAAAKWPHSPPLTLGAMAERLSDPSAGHALAAIDRVLYGPGCDPAELEVAVRAVQLTLTHK